MIVDEAVGDVPAPVEIERRLGDIIGSNKRP
jgi:hypothetical protein